jgi:hypothetical protein
LKSKPAKSLKILGIIPGIITAAINWIIINFKSVSGYWNSIEKKPDQVRLWGILPCLGIELDF